MRNEWQVENLWRRGCAIDVFEFPVTYRRFELQPNTEHQLAFQLGVIEPGSEVRIGVFSNAGVFWSEPFIAPNSHVFPLDVQEVIRP